ncbi:hypothetical protein [Streptomyces variabilis]
MPAPPDVTFFRSRFGFSAPDPTRARLRGAGTVAPAADSSADVADSSADVADASFDGSAGGGGFGDSGVLGGDRGVPGSLRRQIQRPPHLHQQRVVPLKRGQLLLQLGDLGAYPLLLLGVALEVVRHLGDVLRREIGGDGRVVGHEGVLSSCGLPVASHGTAGRG